MWLISKAAWKSMVDHIGVLNHEVGALDSTAKGMQTELTGQGKDIDWIKKLMWILLTVIVGSFAVSAASLVLKLCGVL